jgi:hypothetical protein
LTRKSTKETQEFCVTQESIPGPVLTHPNGNSLEAFMLCFPVVHAIA